MLDSRYIYDTDETTLPLSKELLRSCIDSKPIFSFILCKYEDLIKSINTINHADEIEGTMNCQMLFDSVNSPETNFDCVIKIEGLKKSEDNYIEHVLQSRDDCTWTDFKTYSREMKREIRGMKIELFKRALWNDENLESWVNSSDLADLPQSTRDTLTSDWNVFLNSVIRSKDLEKFISCCTEDSKKLYRDLIYKNSNNLLNRYKVEIMAHATQKNKDDQTVLIKKPVVSKIYISSNNYAKCQKEWPTLRVSSLNKKNLETLGLYL